MKFSSNISRMVFMGVALASLMLVGTALAQQPFPQSFGPTMGAPPPGPIMGMPPPGPPVRMQPLGPPVEGGIIGPCIGTNCKKGGWLYVEAGVKYRNVNTIEINYVPHYIQGGDPGTVLFGPLGNGLFDPGPFVIRYPPFPVAPAVNSDPNFNGNWTYDNGSIRPRFATNWNVNRLPDGGLGHVGEDGDVGRFIVRDPATQASNGLGAFTETTSVSWSLVLEDSVLFSGEVLDDRNLSFKEKIWTPYLEVGVRANPLIDCFFAISWFSVTKSNLNTHPVGVLALGLNRLTDFFPFESNNPDSWLDAVTRSNEQTIDFDFFIFPRGNTDSVTPTRVYDLVNLVASDSDGQPLPPGLAETLANKIDASVIELRAGARRWYSLWRAARVGVSFGPLLGITPYTIDSTQWLVAATNLFDEAELDEDGQDAQPIILQNNVLYRAADSQSGTWWNFGLFGSADAEVGVGPVFTRGSVGYDAYLFPLSYTGTAYTKSRFNPSGWTLAFAGGVNF